MLPILFHGDIRDVDQDKHENEGAPIMGAAVFESQLFKALVDYSDRDPIYVLSESSAGDLDRTKLELRSNYQQRIKFVSANNLEALRYLENLVLMSHGPHMFQFAWLRAQLGKPRWPIVGVIHSLLNTVFFPWFFTNLVTRLYPHDALICSSKAGKEVIEKAFDLIPAGLRGRDKLPFQLPLIPLGINTTELWNPQLKPKARKLLNISATDVVILYFGRFSRIDKCDLFPLLIAFSRLQVHENVTLILSGDDTQSRIAPALEGAAAELGCKRVIVLANPNKDQKIELFAAADIFVSPADNVQETFGISLIEAMSAGLPVIASDWNGYKDLVSHGETGFLVSSYLPALAGTLQIFGLSAHFANYQALAECTNIDITEMVTYLKVLIENPELRLKMGEKARRVAVQRFEWRTIIGQYDQLYESLWRIADVSGEDLSTPSSFLLEGLFEHYATRHLEDRDLLFLNIEGRTLSIKWLVDRAGAHTQFDRELCEQIVALFDSNRSLTIGMVLSALRGAFPTSDLQIRAHIARLVKYDVLRLAVALAAEF
jgi:D-inositol-3-phosphate glycosyltransferase